VPAASPRRPPSPHRHPHGRPSLRDHPQVTACDLQ
jgi:hypothetical protein